MGVEGEAASGVSPGWEGGGGEARCAPPLLPAAGRGCTVGEDTDEHAGKQVELRGEDRQTDKVSISERDRRMERRNQV